MASSTGRRFYRESRASRHCNAPNSRRICKAAIQVLRGSFLRSLIRVPFAAPVYVRSRNSSQPYYRNTFLTRSAPRRPAFRLLAEDAVVTTLEDPDPAPPIAVEVSSSPRRATGSRPSCPTDNALEVSHFRRAEGTYKFTCPLILRTATGSLEKRLGVSQASVRLRCPRIATPSLNARILLARPVPTRSSVTSNSESGRIISSETGLSRSGLSGSSISAANPMCLSASGLRSPNRTVRKARSVRSAGVIPPTLTSRNEYKDYSSQIRQQ